MKCSISVCRAYLEALKSCSTPSSEELGRTVPIPYFDQELILNFLEEANYYFEGCIYPFVQNKDAPLCGRVLMNVPSDVIVIGDLHGNLHNLFTILRTFPLSSHNFLFMGNFIDYGENSLEVALFILSLCITMPNQFFLLRGVNESVSISVFTGLSLDIETIYHSPKIYDKLYEIFSILPAAALIAETVFCCQPAVLRDYKSVEGCLKNIPQKINILKGQEGYGQFISSQNALCDDVVMDFINSTRDYLLDCIICGTCEEGCIKTYGEGQCVSISACECEGQNCVIPLRIGTEVDPYIFEACNQLTRKKQHFRRFAVTAFLSASASSGSCLLNPMGNGKYSIPKKCGSGKKRMMIKRSNNIICMPRVESHPMLSSIGQEAKQGMKQNCSGDKIVSILCSQL